MPNVNRSIRTVIVLFLLAWLCFAIVKPGLALKATPTATPTDPTAPITLDDSTPSIDAVITPIGGATGVVSLELSGVLARLSTANSVEIISIADSRIQSFAFQYASNAPSYVLRIERLPGVTTGRVRILPQSTLPVAIAPTNNAPLTTLSAAVSGIATVAPTAALPVIVEASANLFSAQVSSDSTIQLADNAGITLFKVQVGTGIQAIQAKIIPGLYLAKFTNKDSTAKQDVTVALTGAPDQGTAAPTAEATQGAVSTRRPTLVPTPTLLPPNTAVPVVQPPPGQQPPAQQPPAAPPSGNHGGDDHHGSGGDN